MKRYIYDACWTQELEDSIESVPKTKTLIEEMYYRFGLRVYAEVENCVDKSFLMTLDGLPYCEVFTTQEFNVKKEINEDVYCYYSKYYAKARGKDNEDRHTLRSTKLSKLMTTIEKNNALMPDHTGLLDYNFLYSTVDMVRTAHHTKHKYIGDADVYMVQELLNFALNNKPLGGEIKKNAQVLLDKWNKSDEDNKRTTDKITTMFGNEFYVIGETNERGYAIGSMKINKFARDLRDTDVELIKPFQRVLSLDDYEYIDEIRPVLTMYKLYIEQKTAGKEIAPHRMKQLSPIERAYYEDINVLTNYDSYPAGSSYYPLFTFIPTKTE